MKQQKIGKNQAKQNGQYFDKHEALPEWLIDQHSLFTKQNSKKDANDQNKINMSQDASKLIQLFKNHIHSQQQTGKRIQQLLQLSKASQGNFNSSLPYFSCKNVIFNQYLICLKFYELLRINGSDFSSGPGLTLYKRLVYLKTLILKLGPIQKKLQYQKNKLLKKGQKVKIKQFNQRAIDNKLNQQDSDAIQSDEGQIKQNQSIQQEDQLAYRPMVKNLINKKGTLNNQNENQGKYIAPKQSSVLPAEQKIKRRQQRQTQRRKAHLLKKFRGDIESGDEAQEKDLLQGVDQKFKKKYQQKLRYEQQNFTRLNQTKKQKYWKKQALKNRFKNTMNDEIKQIEMIRQLVEDDKINKSKRPTPIGVKNNTKRQNPKKKIKLS